MLIIIVFVLCIEGPTGDNFFERWLVTFWGSSIIKVWNNNFICGWTGTAYRKGYSHPPECQIGRLFPFVFCLWYFSLKILSNYGFVFVSNEAWSWYMKCRKNNFFWCGLFCYYYINSFLYDTDKKQI